MADKRIAELTKRLRELNIEQAQVIREIESLTTTETEQQTETTDAEGHTLKVGDRVYITNKGKFKEQNGTVNKIGRLVSITLNTGQTTSRKHTNVLKKNA